jgi:hypothetical protein
MKVVKLNLGVGGKQFAGCSGNPGKWNNYMVNTTQLLCRGGSFDQNVDFTGNFIPKAAFRDAR